MSFTVTFEQASVAADWWAQDFMVDGKRQAFRDALREILVGTEVEPPSHWSVPNLILRVDYDPKDQLLDAVRAVGVDCAGMMFSADGIFAKAKRIMWIGDGNVRVHGPRRGQFTFLLGAPSSDYPEWTEGGPR